MFACCETNSPTGKERIKERMTVMPLIHGELCKRIIFYHIEKWYQYKLQTVLQNKIHKESLGFCTPIFLHLSRKTRFNIVNEKKFSKL